MLKNLAVRYDEVEDRLLLRIVADPGDGGETATHWLHITRRVCASWRRDLQAMVDLSAQVPERLDAYAKATISSAHHQAMASRASVRNEPVQPKPADEPRPPQLVSAVVCGRRRDDGRWLMRFDCRGGHQFTLLLSAPTLHALVDAISRRVRSAGWDLPLLSTESANPADAVSAAQLH